MHAPTLPASDPLIPDPSTHSQYNNCAPRGHAPGINIRPGCDDDGWATPTPVSLADGTRIFLYKDGEALRAAYDAIAAATRRIALEVYIFHSDETGNAFADLLCRKSIEGLRVHVIFDSFGCLHTDKLMFQRTARLRRAPRHL